MRFWIDIENAAGDKVGEGPIYNATRCNVKKRLSRAGEWTFEVPATEERVSLITPRREALIFGFINGTKTYLGGGIIEEISTRIGADGMPMLTVSGNDLLRELGRKTTGKVSLDDTGDNNIIALLALTGWTTLREAGSPDFKARLVYESCLNAILTIAEKTGAYYRLSLGSSGQRNLDWFYTITDSGLLATMHGDLVALESNTKVCLITSIEALEDSNDIKTRVFVFGAGEADTAITLASASLWPNGFSAISSDYTLEGQTYRYNAAGNYIDNLTAETAYGRDEQALALKDIGPLTNSSADLTDASNYLVTSAVRWLHARRIPYKSYKLAIAGLRSTLNVGQTIRVQARRYRDGQKPIDINEDLYVLEIQHSIDSDGVRVTGLVVANLPRWRITGEEEIVREMAKTTIIGAHPQTGPNVDTIPYREHVDDTHDAALYFWLGEETTTVQSVIVRFRVDPLRSTVKTVSSNSPTSSASSTSTTPSGGGSTTVSGGGSTSGAVTTGVTNHSHDVEVAGLGSTSGAAVWFNTTDGLHTASGAGVQSGPGTTLRDLTSHVHTTPNHTHATPNHQHNIDHTHTVTPTITTVYGVFDESGANTYAATDLEYNVNGGSYTAITAGHAVSGASGWYQFDITADVSDTATFRPTQPANTVNFRIKAASHATKTAQITVQIERRNSVQSIAVY